MVCRIKEYAMYTSNEIQRMEKMVERNLSAVILSVNPLAVNGTEHLRLKYDTQEAGVSV